MISDVKPPRFTAQDLSAGAEPTDNLPSIPLYIAGLVATICGILAVTLTVGDSNLTTTTVMLAIIGFVFSYGCRYLKLRLYIAHILIVGTIGYFSYGFLSGNIDWRAFMLRNQLDFAVMFAWALTAWSWALVGDGTILLCALLAIATIGLVSSIDISGAVPSCFMGLLCASFFLLAHHQYLQKQARAAREDQGDRRRKSRSPWVTQLAVAASVSAMVFLGASLLVVPAHMVFGGASLAAAISGLSNLAPGVTQSSSGVFVGDDDNLPIGTGSGWSASTAVFAYVETSDGEPHYWRARTYDEYTGGGWQSSMGGRETQLHWHPELGTHPVFTFPHDAFGDAAGGANEITAQFHAIGPTDEMFYTGEPIQVTFDNNQPPQYTYGPPPPVLDRDGQIRLSDQSNIQFPYTFKSSLTPSPDSDAVVDRLRGCDKRFPPAIQGLYIHNLYNSVTTSDDMAYFRNTVSAIVGGLPASRHTEIDEAMAIRDYVSRQAVYSLDVSAMPAGTDHVRMFLQQTRRGYCDLFASSMAVLCRVAGIPARIATGFDPGTNDGHRYVLLDTDKHAWVEVYFPGYGWLTFDPTLGSRSDASVAATTRRQSVNYLRRLQAFLAARGPFVPIVAGLIIAIVLYILKIEFWPPRKRRNRRPPSTPASRAELGRRYERMLRSIAMLGMRKSRAETPTEFAARAVPYLEKLQLSLGTPTAPDTITAVTACYVALRYGDERTRRTVSYDYIDAIDRFTRIATKARWRQLFRRQVKA